VAELIDTQEELFDAADIKQADEPQVEQTQEPVAQEETEEVLPPKYKGKSLDEIVKMHQEAEKLIGRQAQEVGEVRKLADELIKRQLDTRQEVPAAKEDEIDFFEDPKKAVNKAVETHPAILEARQQTLALKQQQTLTKLQQDFPDFQQTVADPSFAEWIKASPVRMRLYAAADADFDFDSAAELLTSWSYVKPKAAPVQQVVPSQEARAAQKAAVKAATVDVGSNSVGNTSSKVYRRADLIRLQLEDPDRYMQLQDEIIAAYSEGRVK
jgi:chemotaxis protein histidine kinase CheA